MEITNKSDITIILKLEDYKGVPMRVSDCADFRVYIWTVNRNNFLQFAKRDIKQGKDFDEIPIPSFMMNCLESGVICYQYRYSKFDDNYEMSDSHYDKSKIVCTDIYFRNCHFHEQPANPINYETLNYLQNKIEKIGLDNETGLKQLKDYIDTDFMDKLDKEVKRSNEVDIEFHKLIKSNKAESDAKDTEIETKLDEEIKRSNEVDIEIFNLIKSNADSDKETTDSITDKLNEEIARSTQKDADHDNAISNETARATNAETVIDTKLEGEIERAKTAEGAIRDAVENERDRATAKETLISDSLTSEINRAKQVESDITTSLQALKTTVQEEKQRSADKDTEHTNNINAEIARATAKENEIATNLQTEVQRAQDREEHINTDLHNEIDRAKSEEARIEALITSNADKDAEVKEAIENEIKRATEKEKELETTISNVDDNLTAEINRAVSEETAIKAAISDNADNIADIQTALNTVSDNLDAEVSRATDKENTIEAKVDTNTTAIADLSDKLEAETNRAKGEEDAIKALITTNTSDISDIANDLTSEIARAKSEEARIENITTTNANNIASEIARSKQVEADITASLQQLKTSVQTKDNEHTTAINDLTTALNAEVSRSTTKDTEIDAKLDIINGDSTVIGSISHSLADSKHYTDDEISKLKTSVSGDVENSLKNYATKAEVDSRIETLIGTAPEALDTLGEIADKLNDNSDVITAINGVLAGKANQSDVYTKNEVDTKETAINNAIATEVSRATNAENTIASDLQTEINRAKAAEKTNADAITIINGGESVIGSISHGVADAKHYADDLLAGVTADLNVTLSNMATKNEVSAVDGKLTAHIAEADGKFATKSDVDDKLATKADTSMLDNYATKTSLQGVADMATANANAIDTINDTLPTKADKSDTYTKTEVDNLIDNVDVTEQLSEYAKIAETTVIKDESGNIITEMVIDNSSADDSVEVYTKEQCDERFMKMWSGTQAQYDALAVKDNN